MFSKLFPNIIQTIGKLTEVNIPQDRCKALDESITIIQRKLNADQEVKLHFICTHNSRRSQFSEIWAKTIAHLYDVPVRSFSGGVEVTAFNTNARAALSEQGFQISSSDKENPECFVSFSDSCEPQKMYSKLIGNAQNPIENFIAFMTCDHASENCPVVAGASHRIELPFEDPKRFDGQKDAVDYYKRTSLQIAAEMSYIFSRIKISNG